MLGATCSECCDGCFCVKLSFATAGTPLAALDGQVIYQSVPETEGPGIIQDGQEFISYGQHPERPWGGSFSIWGWRVRSNADFQTINGIYTRINQIVYPGGVDCPEAVFNQILPIQSELFIDTSLGEHVFRHSSGATVTLARACCKTTPVPYKCNGVVKQYPSTITVRLTPTQTSGPTIVDSGALPSPGNTYPIDFITRTVSLVRNSYGQYIWASVPATDFLIPRTDPLVGTNFLVLTIPELSCRDSGQWYPQLFMNRCVPLVRFTNANREALAPWFSPPRFFSYNNETYFIMDVDPGFPCGSGDFNGSVQSSLSYASIVCEPLETRFFDLDSFLPFTLFDTAASLRRFPVLQSYPLDCRAIPSTFNYWNNALNRLGFGKDITEADETLRMTLKAEIVSCE